jgi:2-polyprenyl-3-methyl-5-hydroxy-6-metoxy-1,4-benzoquinol methylase
MTDQGSLEDVLVAMKGLADLTRLRLVHLLKDGELSVNEIARILEQSQPRVSRHLKLLCDANILERFREQHHIYYRVPTHGLGYNLASILSPFIPENDDQIAKDHRRKLAIAEERQMLNLEYIEKDAPEWTHLHKLHGNPDSFKYSVTSAMQGQAIGSLLDIATGTGRMLEILGPVCRQGIGIDISKKMANVARSKLQQQGLSHCTIRQDDMYQMRFAADTFDTVTIDQVLYFAEQPDAVIEEATRVLTPGGRLLVVAFTSAKSIHNIELGLSPTSIQAWCRNAGLEPDTPISLPGSQANIVLLISTKPY